jgi:Ca-activated chloride channel family protein
MSASNGTAHQLAPDLYLRNERRRRPLEAGVFHLLTQVTAPAIENPERQRPPLNLAFVVDRSGSMSGGALELARQGVEHALRLLDARDRVALVVYDDTIDVLLTLRHAEQEALDKAQRRLRRVQPRGSTDLAGGWLTGCDQLASVDGRSGAPALSRALLLTDGLANVGITAPDEIARHAAELRRRGIGTSTFGVGGHFDEELLAGMADVGGGRYHYIADARSIPAVFAGELGELLQLALRDLTISLRAPHTWRVSLLNDLPIEREGDWLTLRLGELSAREVKALLWQFELPAAQHGAAETLEITLRWQAADSRQTFEHTLRHTIDASANPGHEDERVQDELARVLGARARAEAVSHNRAGRYEAARASVRNAALRMPSTAAGVAEARELDEIAPDFAVPASAELLKKQHALARNRQRTQKDYADNQR